MPASGKSTVGVVIAKRLGLGFVDTDLLIQAQEKKLLKEIGAKDGVANFQFIATENGIKAFEMGYRINGNNDFKVIRKYNDIDFLKMLIKLYKVACRP